jgi:pimeloyl-ACP methyl ester carboxylesterase
VIRVRGRLARFVALACAATACSSHDHAPLIDLGPPVRPAARIPARGAAFHPHDCWGASVLSYAVDCGTVITTGHADGTGGAVELAVAVVYSNGDRVASEPVMFLDGGPGAGSLEALLGDGVPFTSVLHDHDLVLFDQRGTGFSTPKPLCDVSASQVTNPIPVADAGATDAALVVIEKCHTSAVASTDLSIFRSVENAADAEAVRQGLGYASYDVYGVSYGTRYALTVLRDHPSAVKAAIIDSVVPLQTDIVGEQGANVYRAIHLVGSACSSQPSCAARYGDVEAKELAALEHVGAMPPRITLTDGSSATVPAKLVANLLITFMYSSETISLLPELVQELNDEDYTALRALMDAQPSATPIVDTATYLSVTCADEVPFSSPDALTQALVSVPERWRTWVAPTAFYDICRLWNVPPSPAREHVAVTSDVPTLVTSGQFDPVTPPSYGALAAASLSRSHAVVFAGEAHASSVSPCGQNVLHAFLNAPTGSPADACQAASSLSFQSLGATARRFPIAFDTSGRRPTEKLIRSALRRHPFPIFL